MMTDILCTTCGRPNPDDQEYCEFCGSLLEPAGSSLRDSLLPPEDSLQNDTLQPTEPLEDDLIDRKLFDFSLDRDEKDPEPSFSLRDELEQVPELPDFSLDDEEKDPEPSFSLRDELEQVPELPDFSLDDEEKDPEPSFSLRDELEQVPELPDFSLDDEKQDPEPSFSLRDELEQVPGLPDFSLDDEKQDPEPSFSLRDEPEQVPELPDFSLENEKKEPGIPDFSGAAAEHDPGLPDFSLDWGEKDPEVPIPSTKKPEIDPGTPSYPSDKSERDPVVPDDSLKDDGEEGEPVGFTEDSGWLDMLQDPSTADEDDQEPPPPPEQKKPQTDWLEKIKRLNKSREEVDDDSSFPDWLSVSGKGAVQGEKKSEDSDSPSEELPDWLNMDDDDELLNEFLRKKDLIETEVAPPVSAEPVPDEQEKEPEAPSIPQAEHAQSKKFPSWAAADDSQSLGDIEDIPEELQFLAGVSPDSKSGQIVDPFQIEEQDFIDDLFTEDLPSWLTTASEEETIFIEDEITPGELPGWVEAMRPVVESTDATGLSEDEEYIENYGPLAGIPSVLPAEAEVALDPDQLTRKPLGLAVTKTQQEYVNLLKKLLGEEKKVKAIQKTAPVQTQRILRWLIAIILIVSTAGTIIFGGSSQVQLPAEAKINISSWGALYNQIERLHNGEPVLIAFDYQPAATGELRTAAAGVVDHLMEKGAYLSFVSTQPTGPVLAEHFLTTTQERHNYTHNQQYINLGYLPGESAGLLSFVIAPKKIIPLAFDGSNAWGSPPLMNVEKIADFEMILVITDDPNTAKIWIEQVGNNLKDTPLNMVVSAQVEPLIQPYFRSSPQLLSGYVSGIIDSMSYETHLNRPNLANTVWLPFNIGIIITVATIFIGGLANGVLSLFSHHRSRKFGD